MSMTANRREPVPSTRAWRMVPFVIGAGGLIAGFVIALGIPSDGALRFAPAKGSAAPDLVVDAALKPGFDPRAVRPIRHEPAPQAVDALRRIPPIGQRFRVTADDGQPLELEVVSTAPLEFELDRAVPPPGAVPRTGQTASNVVLVTLKVVAGEPADAEPRLVRMILDVPHDRPVGLQPTVLRRKAL